MIPKLPRHTSLFKHVTIHEAAYQQLPLAQRRRLHRAVAMWYEATYGATPGLAPILAHPWGKVGDADKELHYLSAAGEEASLTNASVEAAGFFCRGNSVPSSPIWETVNGPRNEAPSPICPATWRGEVQIGPFARSADRIGRGTGAVPELSDVQSGLAPDGEHGARRYSSKLPIQSCGRPGASRRPPRAADADSTGKPETSLALQRLSQIHYFTNEIAVGSNRAVRA